jgi:hypothetical protein
MMFDNELNDILNNAVSKCSPRRTLSLIHSRSHTLVATIPEQSIISTPSLIKLPHYFNLTISPLVLDVEMSHINSLEARSGGWVPLHYSLAHNGVYVKSLLITFMQYLFHITEMAPEEVACFNIVHTFSSKTGRRI